MGDADLAGQVLTFLRDVMMLHHFLSRMFNPGASGSFEGFKFNAANLKVGPPNQTLYMDFQGPYKKWWVF